VPANRLVQLEREFSVVTDQIANSANDADIARLEKHRDAILAEAREIIHQLVMAEPEWVRKKI
jgi:hypothetical protein